MGRRLSCTVFLFIISLICGNPAHSQSPDGGRGKHFPIGLQLYSVRDDCARDLPGTLKAVAKIGFTGVEFAGYYGRTAPEIKKMLDEDHLQCYGTHVDLNAISGDNLDKTLAFAQGIGCKLVVVPWLPENRRNSTESIIATAGLFAEAAKRAEPLGIGIGWHNENYEFNKIDGETIWQIFWSHAADSIKMQFDIGNALSAGEQAAPYLLKYPKKVYSIHVKDFSTSNKTALLGEGDEHWSEVIPILKTKVHPKYFIIEQESYGEPPLACVEKCRLNFIRLWNSDGKL